MKRQIVEVNGVSCEVIATYFDEDTNKNYIIYTDLTYNREHQLNVYYGLYEMKMGKMNVYPITSADDKKVISSVLKEIVNTI